jgi:hypothetical protein
MPRIKPPRLHSTCSNSTRCSSTSSFTTQPTIRRQHSPVNKLLLINQQAQLTPTLHGSSPHPSLLSSISFQLPLHCLRLTPNLNPSLISITSFTIGISSLPHTPSSSKNPTPTLPRNNDRRHHPGLVHEYLALKSTCTSIRTIPKSLPMTFVSQNASWHSASLATPQSSSNSSQLQPGARRFDPSLSHFSALSRPYSFNTKNTLFSLHHCYPTNHESSLVLPECTSILQMEMNQWKRCGTGKGLKRTHKH